MRIEYGGAGIEAEEIRAVEAVLRKGIQPGEKVAVFEERCARLLGKRRGVMVNSGSSALMIAMRLLALPHGREVIIPRARRVHRQAPMTRSVDRRNRR
jgi:CDP-6-deoxy-D-xylo-4-hexulose-3-dehydrase